MDARAPKEPATGVNRMISVPEEARAALVPIAKRVFWWGTPEEWLNDAVRFAAQVMTFGDWDDTALSIKLLGDSIFRRALEGPPPGVFDIKSWTFWHVRYHLAVPPLPVRRL